MQNKSNTRNTVLVADKLFSEEVRIDNPKYQVHSKWIECRTPALH